MVLFRTNSSFTVSGSTLTFSSALTSSDSIDFILAMGEPLLVGTPSDGLLIQHNLQQMEFTTGAKIENNPTLLEHLQLYTVGGTFNFTGNCKCKWNTFQSTGLITARTLVITCIDWNWFNSNIH